MASPKRGRPPIGRKAMTPAERQARRRKRLREAEAARRKGRDPSWRAYQPPHGYVVAKEQLIREGHEFERVRREFGFEEGVFVDGAFMGTFDVIELARLPTRERQQNLAEQRLATKDFACGAVRGYMAALRVSLAELVTAKEQSA
jgi:hypothetical protein